MNGLRGQIGGCEISQPAGVKSVAVGESPYPVLFGRHCLLRLNRRNEAFVCGLNRDQHGLPPCLSQLVRNGGLNLERVQFWSLKSAQMTEGEPD